MAIINNNILINKLNNAEHKKNIKKKELQNNNTFNQILQNTKDDKDKITFSKHATMRLDSRNIDLSVSQMKRLEDGVKKAEQKGITDSLILLDNVALVVNIKNKKVVTAIEDNKDRVYTNINGAVIV